MKNFKWYDWATLTVLMAMLLGGFAFSPWGRSILQSDSAPAWVQAVGALFALGIAIWVPARQHQLELSHARDREAEDLRRTLTSIRDELEVRYEQYRALIQPEIYEAKEKEFLACYWLLPGNSFPVYHSVLAKLSAIESASLRKTIVRCYALMEGLLKTIDCNSDLARSYMAAQVSLTLNPCQQTHDAFELARQALEDYFPRVLESDEHAVASLHDLLAMLPQGAPLANCGEQPPVAAPQAGGPVNP